MDAFIPCSAACMATAAACWKSAIACMVAPGCMFGNGRAAGRGLMLAMAVLAAAARASPVVGSNSTGFSGFGFNCGTGSPISESKECASSKRRVSSSFCCLRAPFARPRKMTLRCNSSTSNFFRRRDSLAALRFCAKRRARDCSGVRFFEGIACIGEISVEAEASTIRFLSGITSVLMVGVQYWCELWALSFVFLKVVMTSAMTSRTRMSLVRSLLICLQYARKSKY